MVELADLPGVGEKTAEKLRDAYKLKDVKTLYEIANIKLPLLTEQVNAFKEKSLKIWYSIEVEHLSI